jgi:hypothetical protein
MSHALCKIELQIQQMGRRKYNFRLAALIYLTAWLRGICTSAYNLKIIYNDPQ